jgi:hypothetical protein
MKFLHSTLLYLFTWLGSRLFTSVVVTSKDGETVDAVLFSNSEKVSNQYMNKIKP